jgi:hypothetical protein
VGGAEQDEAHHPRCWLAREERGDLRAPGVAGDHPSTRDGVHERADGVEEILAIGEPEGATPAEGNQMRREAPGGHLVHERSVGFRIDQRAERNRR